MSAAVPETARALWREAVIERVVPRTPRVVSVFLRCDLPRSIAGQYVDVRLSAADGYQAQRSYSVASQPGAALLELVIEKLDDGEVSPYFHEVAQAGDTIDLRGPIGGRFVWRAQDGGPLLLIGGGSGVAPLVAMAREQGAQAPDVPTLLIYSARTSDDLIFREDLLQADATVANFALVAVTTRGPALRPQDFARRLDAPMLAEILARFGQTPRHIFVCGSTRFVETAADLLIEVGLPPQAIRTERYGGA